MRVVVCGGAGYIGSHMVRKLIEAGHTPVIFDNMSTGHQWALAEAFKGAEAKNIQPVVVSGDVLNMADLENLFEKNQADAVMHFSARSLVSESVQKPDLYYHGILVGSLNLLAAANRARVDKFIFSSTAAVYGTPDQTPIEENCPARPITPYGHATRMVEMILEDYAQAQGLKSVALRYFNAAGADPDGGLGEDHTPETHLIPNVLKAILGQTPPLEIFGNDYPTPDGTCIRDYVYVGDVAQAHLLALNYLNSQPEPGFSAFNIGSGKGFSVLEVMAAAERVTGQWVPYAFAHRRQGDPPVLVASAEKAKKTLGWNPEIPSLDEIIRTAWRWFSRRAQPS
ncbi:MAG: UDP-glucose 4-epimerase GalE [Candidatus Adiutrix sp.]|jgi:UDP-glucose 4-epimerase|nr:UDP-glucose 4-epimerase GalE [Candidatus Adiutrix sp.]